MKTGLTLMLVGIGASTLLFMRWQKPHYRPEKPVIEKSNLIPFEDQSTRMLPTLKKSAQPKEPDNFDMPDKDQRRHTIAEIEANLEVGNAIERLNTGQVTQEERHEIGKRLKALDDLRIHQVENELRAIAGEVARLESNLATSKRGDEANRP